MRLAHLILNSYIQASSRPSTVMLMLGHISVLQGSNACWSCRFFSTKYPITGLPPSLRGGFQASVMEFLVRSV